MYDDFDDISVTYCSANCINERLSWDIYMTYSRNMWVYVNFEGVLECSVYDYSIKRQNVSFYPVKVEPSHALFMLSVRSSDNISVFDAISCFTDYIELNIEWFNSVKFNDIREPLQPPVNLLLYNRILG